MKFEKNGYVQVLPAEKTQQGIRAIGLTPCALGTMLVSEE
jgi:hypothetical protein